MRRQNLPNVNSRLDALGWVCVCLEGDPYELGRQHGRLLAREIEDALRTAKFLCKWDTGEEFNAFKSTAVAQFSSHLGREYLDEIRGITEGCRRAGVDTSFEELLAWNGYLDLMSWWPTRPTSNPTVGFQKWKGRGGHHCSAFIANGSFTRHGEIVVAHNTWDRYAAADCNNIIFDLRPTKGNRIVMQGIPGCISSLTDFWETSAGLVVVETTISNFGGYNPKGAPEFYRSRKACQYAQSIDEWCNYFSTNSNSGYANSWLLGDIKTGEIARYELGMGSHSSLVRTADGFYSGFNTPFDLKIRNQDCTGEGEEFSDIRKNGARRLRWLQLSKKFHGKLDVTVARKMIADHYDVYLKRDNPSSRTICGHFELDDARLGGTDGQAPYYPRGSNDGKVTDSDMIRNLSLWARWGHACGERFNADAFIRKHPQWEWLSGYMRNRPSYPWSVFSATN
jgi:Phospholipase B